MAVEETVEEEEDLDLVVEEIVEEVGVVFKGVEGIVVEVVALLHTTNFESTIHNKISTLKWCSLKSINCKRMTLLVVHCYYYRNRLTTIRLGRTAQANKAELMKLKERMDRNRATK